MYRILRDNKRRFGNIWSELDANFLTICNALIKFANPNLQLKDYATPQKATPETPTENDAYLIIESGDVFGVSAAVNNIIYYNGSNWLLLPYKITELNTLFQALFFEAEKISLDPVPGLSATNVQTAIEELSDKINDAHPGSGSNSI